MMTRWAVLLAVALFFAPAGGRAAAPLDRLMLRHADLRAGYTARYSFAPGYTRRPALMTENHLPLATYRQHGYLISYDASWQDPGRPPGPHLSVSAVEETGDSYRGAAGAHWGYELARARKIYTRAGGLQGRALAMPRVGDESSAFAFVPPEAPFPAVAIVFRRNGYVVSVTGLGTASGLKWPGLRPVQGTNPVLRMARLIDARIVASG